VLASKAFPPAPDRCSCFSGTRIDDLVLEITASWAAHGSGGVQLNNPTYCGGVPSKYKRKLKPRFRVTAGNFAISGGVLAMAIFEACILLQKRQRHVAGRSVALFSDDKLGLAGFFLLSLVVGLVELGAYE